MVLCILSNKFIMENLGIFVFLRILILIVLKEYKDCEKYIMYDELGFIEDGKIKICLIRVLNVYVFVYIRINV